MNENLTNSPDQSDTFLSSSRVFSGRAEAVLKIILSIAALLFLFNVAGVPSYFGVFLLPPEYNGLFLAVVLPFTFIRKPASASSPMNRVPWYDVLLALVSIVGCLYFTLIARDVMSFARPDPTLLEILLGLAMVGALMEATRRSFGWTMVVVVTGFLLYARFGSYLPGALNLYPAETAEIINDIYISPEGMFGSLTTLATTIIFVFMIFGTVFLAVGGGAFFLDLAVGLTGFMRGGPAKGAIVGSAMFGSLTGSAVANVVVTGNVTIPLMKRTGYSATYASAVETIASIGGGITPPVMGGLAFIMALMLGTTYAEIAIIAIIPAFLYYLAMFIQSDLHAAKKGMRGLPRSELPRISKVLAEGWEFLIPPVLIILMLFVYRYDVVLTAIYATLALIAISFFRERHRLTFRKYLDSLNTGMEEMFSLINVIALAAILVALLGVTGIGPKISGALVTLLGGNMILLVLASALVCYILGMGVSTVASYILVVSIIAPAMSDFGIEPIVTHFFVMFMVLSSYFTPPYCPVAFVAAGIGKAKPFAVGFTAMRLGITVFLIPVAIMIRPELLLIGELPEIIMATITAILSVIVASVALEGYLLAPIKSWLRLVFVAPVAFLFLPSTVPNTFLALATFLSLVAIHWWLDVRRSAIALSA